MTACALTPLMPQVLPLNLNLLLLSNNSFSKPYTRLGLQQFALEWAQLGHHVDYVCCPTHPLDFISSISSLSLAASLVKSGSTCISTNLPNIFLRSPFSRRRFWWRGKWQTSFYKMFFPKQLSKKTYDLCIFDVCFSALNLSELPRKRKILRLNDNPWGFFAPHESHCSTVV